MLTSNELRKKFIEFYKARGHREIPQASLVPTQDTSVLFTTAGMHPLIPYLLGDQHPEGKRLVNIQRSLRTTDIEKVGDDTHSTLFEMLGHWSLGDYFKREAIEWSYQFVTEILGFPKEKIAVTIYRGNPDKGIETDDEAKGIWQELGIGRIAELGDEDNWWGPVHSTGPCGPTTEIFVYVGNGRPSNDSLPGSKKDHQWVEIWNNVFLEYNKISDTEYKPLKQKNIDTGVGLERILMTVNGFKSIYETDVYQPIVQAISTDPNAHIKHDVRVIADHVRAAVFLIADGVQPSNKDRGYILRRLIRRAVNAARQLGFDNWDMAIDAVLGVYSEYYPHLLNIDVARIFQEEQQKFSRQLARAVTFITKSIPKIDHNPQALAKLVFLAFQSHALPTELGLAILKEQGITVDFSKIEQMLIKEMKAHQKISAQGQEKKFGGHGLILDTGELKAGNQEELSKVLRLHTATHLLQAGLRAILGDHVTQKGSDINPDRLRFDFTHGEKMTLDQIQAVEAWVNDKIAQDLPVQKVELPLEEAKKTGALHFFTHKYPPRVSVYFIGQDLGSAVSREFCGGPHVERTGIIGRFKIIKEQSASAGVRRIKAVVE